MNRTYLGEFEEIVLLTVALLDGRAYGVALLEELQAQTGRAASLSAIHTTLQRLEEKGLVASVLGGATAERGGRRKRLFSVTAAGRRALQDSHETRTRLFNLIPRLA